MRTPNGVLTEGPEHLPKNSLADESNENPMRTPRESH